jgi:hypothetical protein
MCALFSRAQNGESPSQGRGAQQTTGRAAELAAQRRLQAHARSVERDAERGRIVAAARHNAEQTTRELAERFGVTYYFAWKALRDADVHVRVDKHGHRRRTQAREVRAA